MQWSIKIESGISYPFDGVPFLSAGSLHFQCHQGKDVDKKTKERRQQELDAKEVKTDSCVC